jgi:hypothetical protein
MFVPGSSFRERERERERSSQGGGETGRREKERGSFSFPLLPASPPPCESLLSVDPGTNLGDGVLDSGA